jgi:hypothetical protein
LLYYVIYRLYPYSFSYNADVFHAQSEAFKSEMERKINEINLKLEALIYLLKYIENKTGLLEEEKSLTGSKIFIQTAYYKYEFRRSVVVVPAPLAVPRIALSVHIYDDKGHRIGFEPIDSGDIPNRIEEYPKLASNLINKLEASLIKHQHGIETLTSRWPKIWTFWDFLYFSTITQTTVGYGDILPNRTLVRMFIVLQILMGLLMLGIAVNFVFQSS